MSERKNIIEKTCIKCGKRDHSASECTNDNDKPIYNEAMEVISDLKQQLAKKEKELKTEKLIYSIEKEQMKNNFNQCKNAAEHWKSRAEKDEAELSELRERMKGVEEVYKKYNGTDVPLHLNYASHHDLWRAIKHAVEGK